MDFYLGYCLSVASEIKKGGLQASGDGREGEYTTSRGRSRAVLHSYMTSC